MMLAHSLILKVMGKRVYERYAGGYKWSNIRIIINY